MATEILYPQDCLERLRFSPPSSFPRRKTFSNHTSNTKPSRKQSSRPESKRRTPSPPLPQSGHLVSKKPTVPDSKAPTKNFVIGQVTILKRGEPLDLKRIQDYNNENNLKKTLSGELKSELKKDLKKVFSDGDLIVCGTDRLGPDPEQVQVRLTDLKPLNFPTDVYAGSAFALSPSPRALPLPKFSIKKGCGSGISAVDDSATKDLRRLLRIGG